MIKKTKEKPEAEKEVELISAAEYCRRKKGALSLNIVKRHLISGYLPSTKSATGAYIIDWEATKDLLPRVQGEDYNINKTSDARRKEPKAEDKIPELSVNLIKNDYLTLHWPTEKQIKNDPTLRDFNNTVISVVLLDLMLGLTLAEAAVRQGLDIDVVGHWEATNTGNFGKVTAATIVEFKRYHLEKVRNGSFNYNMSTWILERKFREEFGKQSTIIVDDKIQKTRQVMKVGEKEVVFD